MHVSLDNDDITEDVGEMISKDDPDKFLINHPGAHHAPGLTAGDLGGASLSHDNNCQVNKTFIWCLPMDYNQEKHPFTCKFNCSSISSMIKPFLCDFLSFGRKF